MSDDASIRRSAVTGLPDAQQIHGLLKSLQACGNEVRLALLEALRTLYEASLCYELGYTSFEQYCDRELGLPRSTAYEYVRAGRALDELPLVRCQFREGELSWVQVRAITRVATSETEEQWVELAWREPVRDLLAEVQEAQRTGRDAPRERRHGLPNLLVDLGLKVTLEEKARIRAAFAVVDEALNAWVDAAARESTAAVAGTAAAGMVAPAVTDPRPALVRWADAVLAGAIPAGPVVSVGTVGAVGAAAIAQTAEAARRVGTVEAGGAAPTVSTAETAATAEGAGTSGVGRSRGISEAVRTVGPGAVVEAVPTVRIGRAAAADEMGLEVGAAPRAGPARTGRVAPKVRAHEGPRVAQGRRLPAQTIVYYACPECRRSTVETEDGLIGVTPERIEELAPHSNRVAIDADDKALMAMPDGNQLDAPNSARLRRQVLHRDGLVCANPGCGRRRELQAHHVEFRAAGGRTVLSNEVAVCATCHALIHKGLLELSGRPDTGLRWTPRPMDAAAKVRDAEALLRRARELTAGVHGSSIPGRGGARQLPAGESQPETGPVGHGGKHCGLHRGLHPDQHQSSWTESPQETVPPEHSVRHRGLHVDHHRSAPHESPRAGLRAEWAGRQGGRRLDHHRRYANESPRETRPTPRCASRRDGDNGRRRSWRPGSPRETGSAERAVQHIGHHLEHDRASPFESPRETRSTDRCASRRDGATGGR